MWIQIEPEESKLNRLNPQRYPQMSTKPEDIFQDGPFWSVQLQLVVAINKLKPTDYSRDCINHIWHDLKSYG